MLKACLLCREGEIVYPFYINNSERAFDTVTGNMRIPVATLVDYCGNTLFVFGTPADEYSSQVVVTVINSQTGDNLLNISSNTVICAVSQDGTLVDLTTEQYNNLGHLIEEEFILSQQSNIYILKV